VPLKSAKKQFLHQISVFITQETRPGITKLKIFKELKLIQGKNKIKLH